jgi:hypothetical protein
MPHWLNTLEILESTTTDREYLHHTARSSFDFTGVLPALRTYTRIAARCLGDAILLRPQVQCVPVEKGSPIDHLRLLVRFAFRRYGCEMPPVELGISPYIRSSQSAAGAWGMVGIRNGIWSMDIAEPCTHDPFNFLTTVAHEVAHIVLFLRHGWPGNRCENESLTDTLSIMGGFGPIILMSNCTHADGNHAERAALGYLHPSAVAFLAAKRARMSGESLHSDSVWLPAATERLRHLSLSQFAWTTPYGVCVCDCIACGHAIPFRAARPGRVRLGCPLCAFPQIITVTH